ncbi:universal stress protein [Nocardiopsis sp. RSe5-2]|uniref:Universal stress protein n=1 Tax=Nocardiopsis endophytica TaxID=3018445 RepID=A0ABT4U732_9ACTN|nr:universal stress protein [Nocardiopsis endophytica]MDA2812756.1 universal stress protein [Nocardiopsis endophytica]
MEPRIPAGPTPHMVVGFDGSPPAAFALEWAVREARLRDCDLWAVLVLDDGNAPHAPYAGAHALPRTGPAARDLRSAAERAGRSWPRVHHAVFRDDLAARGLARAAEGAQLLVLGARGPSGPGAPALGPTASACLRVAPCPVVLVGPEQAPCAPHDDAPARRRTPEPVGSAGGGRS